MSLQGFGIATPVTSCPQPFMSSIFSTPALQPSSPHSKGTTESALELISRPLPTLNKLGGTTHPSRSNENVSARFFYEWENFESDVIQACASLDLGQLVSLTDEVEEYRTASELGLTGRFSKHVCDAVMKALSVTHLSNMKFGDYQALPPHDAEKVPDVVMLSLLDSIALLVGELKTFWTLLLENHPISRGFPALVPLQPHLGQLISYMRSSNLRFGFLSTYRSTVFVRRTAPFRFEMSMPISEKSTNPSIRQCFVAMALFASQDPTFIEPADFIAEQLSISADVFCQASTRPSPFQNQIAAKQNTLDENIGSQSILFGADNSIATTLVNCKRRIHGSKHKAVYEVTWDGQPAIAKCWSPSYYQSYAHEAMTYENIYAKRPQGYSFFAMMLSHGTISCSSLFPKGNILIMTKVPGKTLNESWDTISGLEKEHIRSEILKAVLILRSFSVLSVDTGKHNILYHPGTRSVTMIDFEIMQACEDTLSPDMPEMYTIFGEMPVPTRVHHCGS